MFTMREQLRYKLYVNMGPAWHTRLTDPQRKDMNMRMYANYSQPCYVDTLNKENERRLRILMDSATPMYTYIPDVGYKIPYRYAKGTPDYHTVYVIDGVVKRMDQLDDSGREKINLRRVRWSKVSHWYKCLWVNGDYIKQEKDEAWIRAVSNDWPSPVFMDRLTKKEKDKLSMLMLMPDNKYLDGFGSVRTSHKGERLFYLEVDEDENE